MKTSVIICFYNRLDMLPACLDSLRGSSAEFHEVVIADDGSSEEVVKNLQELIKKYDFPIIHAWHPRQGPRRSATRNNGIRHATGDHLIFLDADFTLLPGAIHSHIDVAKPGYFAAGRSIEGGWWDSGMVSCSLSIPPSHYPAVGQFGFWHHP